MGGDQAPLIVVEGAELSRKKFRNVRFIFFGDEQEISTVLDRFPKLKSRSDIHHTPDRVENEEKPSVALRSGRNSSMRLAINSVSEGQAHAVVSAGNTGALMAMAKFVFKVLPGIKRPAIASYFPTMKSGHGTVLLDLGANIVCDARNLAEFSVLGAVFSREVLKVQTPRVGILNVGEEEMKGNEQVKEAAQLLSRTQSKISKYIGFVEGNDITNGSVDVVVTDGFTGNITLKATEGLAKLMMQSIKDALKASWLSWFGLAFMIPAYFAVKKRMDPRRYNGGVFMGLRGLCVKSHGGTDAFGFSNAINVSLKMVQSQFNDKVAQELETLAISDNAKDNT